MTYLQQMEFLETRVCCFFEKNIGIDFKKCSNVSFFLIFVGDEFSGLIGIQVYCFCRKAAFARLCNNDHLFKSQSFRTGGFKYHEISMSVK